MKPQTNKKVARATISMDGDLFEALKAEAERDSRGVSSYITMVVKEDLQKRGVLPESEEDEMVMATFREAKRIHGNERVHQLLFELIQKRASSDG